MSDTEPKHVAVVKTTIAKAQITAILTSIVGVLELINVMLPVDGNVKLYIGFAVAVIGIVGNVYGVYKVPNKPVIDGGTIEPGTPVKITSL